MEESSGSTFAADDLRQSAFQRAKPAIGAAFVVILGLAIILLPKIFTSTVGFDAVWLLFVCQIGGSLLASIAFIRFMFETVYDTGGFEAARSAMAILLLSTSVFLFLDWRNFWGFFPASIFGAIVIVFSGWALVKRSLGEEARAWRVTFQKRLRRPLRRKPVISGALIGLLFGIAFCTGFLSLYSNGHPESRVVAGVVSLVFICCAVQLLRQFAKARRYRGDQDLGDSGIDALEIMKSDFQEAQRTLTRLTNDMGSSIRRIDEMIHTTAQLEVTAENAKHLATFSEEQAEALLVRMARHQRNSTVWGGIWFGLGVLVTLATANHAQIAGFVRESLPAMGF